MKGGVRVEGRWQSGEGRGRELMDGRLATVSGQR